MTRGFTLVELLIVIAILAVLGTIAVLVINPAQMLAQARDSQRVADMAAVRSALGLYASTATTVTFGETGTCQVGTSHSGTTCTANSSTVVTGTGWVQVDLTGTTGGSPIGSLPLDPSMTTVYYYAYDGDNTNDVFELNARLESTKYRTKMETDGGNDNTCSNYTEATCYYEVGTTTGLSLY